MRPLNFSDRPFRKKQFLIFLTISKKCTPVKVPIMKEIFFYQRSQESNPGRQGEKLELYHWAIRMNTFKCKKDNPNENVAVAAKIIFSSNE